MKTTPVGGAGSLQQPLLVHAELPASMADGHAATPLVDVDEGIQYSRLLGRELKGRQSAGVFNVRRKHT